MTLKVCDLDQLVAMTTLKAGLLKNDFIFSLEKRYPKDVIEMLMKAKKYANAEEAYGQKVTSPRKERRWWMKEKGT